MPPADASRRRCAIYTRKSSEEGLEQEFNSLAAQREACEAYIRSQQHEGWVLARNRYDDGGFSGGNIERPALQRLLADIGTGRVDIVVVYKVDRLTRSLADFGRTYDVLVLDGGFSWQDTHYRSLSALARKITGTAWSGPLFFGLKPSRPATRRSSQVPGPAGEPMESSNAAG